MHAIGAHDTLERVLFQWFSDMFGFGGKVSVIFLGSQGDIWDAQKDILADPLGALTSPALYPLKNKSFQ